MPSSMSLIRASCSTRYGSTGLLRQNRQSFRSSPRFIAPSRRESVAAIRSSSGLLAPLVIGTSFTAFHLPNTTGCEQHAIVSYPTRRTAHTPHQVHVDASKWRRLGRSILRYWRALKRFVQLSITLAPVMIFYPFVLMLSDATAADDGDGKKLDAHDVLLMQQPGAQTKGFLGWYLRVCLTCVEYSGAAVIKLMQWAGSRPDLFGHDFCAVFSALQDHTTPHAKSHTIKVLRQALGDDWESKVRLGDILGSGCIGQVYKGSITLDNGVSQEVALKVLHPNVDSDIEADLDLMRAGVRVAQWLPFDVFANLKWLNLEGVVEEFADLLKLQLDLRTEAANLRKFNENFLYQDDVVFPKLVPGFTPTKDLLVETFVEGIPVLKYARQHGDDQKLLTNLCTSAIRAVCKMIFLDNYMHGDLHPGNVVINASGPKPKFVLYDVGIVAEYNDHDHQTIVDILAAFVRKQGRKAGRLMIDDSNARLWHNKSGDRAMDEEGFIDKIEWLTIQASKPDYFMEQLGSYISFICSAAAEHHVMLNPSFVSAALAVKVEEGIALALDPTVKITTVAIPVIIESESRRYGEKAKRKLGERLENLRTRIFGRRKEETTRE